MPRSPGWDLPRLTAWRRFRGLTPTELAAKTGIAPSMLSRLEHGTARAGGQSLDRLSAALDITREQLLHEEPGEGR